MKASVKTRFDGLLLLAPFLMNENLPSAVSMYWSLNGDTN